MNKLKFYQIATLLLLLLNVGFILLGLIRPPMDNRNSAHRMTKELALSDSQNELFRSLRIAHHEALMEINIQQREVLNNYFKNLPNTYNETDADLLISAICQVEGSKVDLTYRHFQDLYEMLNEDQKENYKPVVEKALASILMLPKKKMK